MNKKGTKNLFYPLFGQKLAEYVLFVETILCNVCEVHQKNLDMGDQWLDGGGLRIFLMGGGTGLHGGRGQGSDLVTLLIENFLGKNLDQKFFVQTNFRPFLVKGKVR